MQERHIQNCLCPISRRLNWGKNPKISETIVVHRDRKLQKSLILLFLLSPQCFPHMRRGEESISCGSNSVNRVCSRDFSQASILIYAVVPKKEKFFPFLPTPNPVYIYYDLSICICRCISSIYT